MIDTFTVYVDPLCFHCYEKRDRIHGITVLKQFRAQNLNCHSLKLKCDANSGSVQN